MQESIEYIEKAIKKLELKRLACLTTNDRIIASELNDCIILLNATKNKIEDILGD